MSFRDLVVYGHSTLGGRCTRCGGPVVRVEHLELWRCGMCRAEVNDVQLAAAGISQPAHVIEHACSPLTVIETYERCAPTKECIPRAIDVRAWSMPWWRRLWAWLRWERVDHEKVRERAAITGRILRLLDDGVDPELEAHALTVIAPPGDGVDKLV